MAAVTGAVIAAGSTAYSISQSIKAAQQKKEAAKEISKLEAPELINSGDSLSVSTLGSDALRQEQARNSANLTQAASDSGTRGIIGSAGTIAAKNMETNSKIAANLDEQQKAIDMYKAQERSNIRSEENQRFRDKLAALSSQFNASNQNQNTFMGSAIDATGAFIKAAPGAQEQIKQWTTKTV
jgi:parvulin-like peptidyl-prolyl isomerase